MALKKRVLDTANSGKEDKSQRKNNAGAKRHKIVAKDPLERIPRPCMKRLARRAGIKRCSSQVYDSTRLSIGKFLKSTLFDAIVCAQHSKRTTLTENDVNFAFKRQGRTLY